MDGAAREPGWGARLEARVASGELTMEQAAQELLSSSSSSKRTKLDLSPPPMQLLLPEDAVQIGRRLGGLKRVPRTGWIARLEGQQQHPEQRVESVADHSFRIAGLAMLLTTAPEDGEQLDMARLLGMAVVHDLAESIVGDIAPHQQIPAQVKQKMEHDAMLEMERELSSSDSQAAFHSRVFTLWQAYEDRTTKEAKLIKDLDRFEMCLQAYEYEEATASGVKVDLEDFFASVRGKIQSPQVLAWFQALERMRRGSRNVAT